MDSPPSMSSSSSSPAKRGLQSQSFSSSSSFSSCSSSFRSNSFPSTQEISPLSPLPYFQLSKVPFSWEQLPGIPKKYSNHGSTRDESSTAAMLPLPPSAGAAHYSTGKRNMHASSERDPFAMALVECSKEEVTPHHKYQVEKYWKVSRGVSDRFSFIDRYASCKKSCAVAESVVLLPRSFRNATQSPF